MNVSFLGLMRKANALLPGQDRVLEGAKSGQAKLILLPSDAPARAERSAVNMENTYGIRLLRLPWTSGEVARAIGVGRCNLLAVTDHSFSMALIKAMDRE